MGERHPLFSPARLSQAERYLAEQFASLGLAVSSHAFEVFGRSFHNVVATKHVAGPATIPPLILAAHYDTVPGSPGADDNASGLAVLLETARALREARLAAEVRFIAFCLEEEDLLGSRAYVTHLRERREPIAGAIVLECVGCCRHEEGSQTIPPGIPIAVPSVGNFLAVIGNEAATPLVGACVRAAGLPDHALPTVPLIVPGQGQALPDTRRSDHAAFWDEDLPAVMLTDTANFRNAHYHQTTDTIDTLDFSFMAQVARMLAATVVALAGETAASPDTSSTPDIPDVPPQPR